MSLLGLKTLQNFLEFILAASPGIFIFIMFLREVDKGKKIHKKLMQLKQ